MSDEDCEDLPPVAIITSPQHHAFVMPRADELAAQRERERRCERDLQQAPAAPDRHDSSGSEGEGALAAALGALLRDAPAPPAPAPTPRALAAALAPALPSAERLLTAYSAAPKLRALDDALVSTVRAAIRSGGMDESARAAALALLLSLAGGGRCGVRAARAVHALLAGDEGCGVAGAAGRTWDGDALLEAADAVRGGGEAGEAAAGALARAAGEAGCGRGAQLAVLRAAGRERARGASAPLPVLAPPPSPSIPSNLPLLAAMSRLRVLYPDMAP